MKKMFTENLPRSERSQNKGHIDWYKCAENKVTVDFIYKQVKGTVQILAYDGQMLDVKYLDKDIYKMGIGSFRDCCLGDLIGLHYADFKFEIGKEFKDEKRDITILDREYRIKKHNRAMKWYKFRCNKCGWDEGWKIESGLLVSGSCLVCGDKVDILVEGINDIPTTAPWMIKFFQGGYDEAKLYIKSSAKKINAVCPDCGKIKENGIEIRTIYQKRKIPCLCGDNFSYPEKFMYDILKQTNIDFTYQYCPDWIKPKKYDFYFELNNKKYIIEMDGGLGHGKKIIKDNMTAKESLELDNYKDRLAKENGVDVVRIECDESQLEYIKENIFKSRLPEILNISKDSINWEKVEEFCATNICKKVCEIRYNNPTLTTTQICEITGIGKTAVINYLKKGHTIGWCDYDSEKEKRRVDRMKGKNGKKVEVFKDDISLGVFDSLTELTRQSKDMLGVEIKNTTNISQVCLGRKKEHMGFVFKHVD